MIVALTSDDDGERRRGFATFAAIYWRPLYKYLRVAKHRDGAGAEDLTQSFLMSCLENGALAGYDAAKASFRTFLRVLFDRFVANDTKAALRQKRGGGAISLDFEYAEEEIAREHNRGGSPEEYFQREWVRSVFSVAVERLRVQCESAGKHKHFALFQAYDLGEASNVSYRELGERFGVSESVVTNWLSATRRQFRGVVLDVLREATATEAEYRAEVRALLGVVE